MTKREMLNAIKARVADNADMVAFIDKELAALDARNAKATIKRSNATEVKKEAVYDALVFVGEQVTATELIENAPNEVAGYSRQKVSHALNELVKDGKVEREMYKRVAYFRAVA